MRGIIFLNGDHSQTTQVSLSGEDLSVCADGGARLAHRLGLRVDVLVGDFDSLAPELRESLIRNGVRTVELDVYKDFTDFEAAICETISRGITQVTVYGAFGGRIDQFLGNLLIAAQTKFRHVTFDFRDDLTRVVLLRASEVLSLAGSTRQIFSVVPITDLTGLTIGGARWNLSDATVEIGSSRTISNEFSGPEVTVSLGEGLAFVVQDLQKAAS